MKLFWWFVTFHSVMMAWGYFGTVVTFRRGGRTFYMNLFILVLNAVMLGIWWSLLTT